MYSFLGGKLAVGFVGCDGGSKDESSPPKNVLSENWTTEGDVYTELRPISTQENKHGIRPDRNKIEPAHGLSVPVFCSSLNL